MMRNQAKLVKLLLIVLLGVVPAFIDNRYLIHLLTTCMIYVILYLGLNLLIGLSGQVSLGHSAFYGFGAYTAGILCTKVGMPFIVALPAGTLVSIAVGALLGFPAARLKGPYLTMTTLGITQLFTLLAVNLVGITNGPVGMAAIGPISFFGFTAKSRYSIFVIMFVFAVLATIVFNRIKDGPIGRAWRAKRDSAIAAEAMGLNLTWYNVLAFSICSAFAGFAGVLWAYYTTYISPDQFNLALSFSIVSVLVIGGRGTVLGTVIAALLQTLVPEYLRFLGDWRHIVFALLLIIVVLFTPDGCAGLLIRLKNYVLARWKASKKEVASDG